MRQPWGCYMHLTKHTLRGQAQYGRRSEIHAFLCTTDILYLRGLFTAFVHQELFQLPAIRQLQLIGRYEKPVIHVAEGVFHHLLSLAGAKQDSHRRVVARLHFMLGIIADIGIQLSYVFVSELVVFQLHNDVAVKQPVVENEVCKIILPVYDDAFLTRLETEAFPQFLCQQIYYAK